MPRPPTTTIRTVAAGPSDEARREFRASIELVLTFANRHVANDWHPASEDFCRPLGEILHRALTLLSTGRGGSFSGWPMWAVIGFGNIRSLVNSGGAYLRRCRECERWFLTRDNRQHLCIRKACKLNAARQRRAGARRVERERLSH